MAKRSLKLPAAGEVYVFKTSPYSEFAPETGRYAVLRILGADRKLAAVAVLAGVWGAPPQLDEARRSPILREHRFSHQGRQAVFGVATSFWRAPELIELVLLGAGDVSAEEAALAAGVLSYAPGSRYTTPAAANFAAEGEWRWANDREALIEEATRERAKQRGGTRRARGAIPDAAEQPDLGSAALGDAVRALVPVAALSARRVHQGGARGHP